MRTSDDAHLLERWRNARDRGAMDELVRRHIHFVYGAARRQLRGDDAWAQDVTQAVFMLLVQKSPHVRSEAALAVWLHRTTRYACANARRMRARRVAHERRAARPEHAVETETSHDELAAALDDAIAQLGPRDRDGVVLCYFQRRSYREIGAALGLSEPAARKRVSRAVERMREFFASRGIVTTTAAVAACLARESAAAAAPAPLSAAASSFAGLSQLVSGASSAPASQIVKGVLAGMFVTKLKLAAACAAMTFGGLFATAAIQHADPAPTRTTEPRMLMTRGEEEPSHVADLGGGNQIEFLGVSPRPAAHKGWFAIDGKPVEGNPSGPWIGRDPPAGDATHVLALHRTGPGDVGIRMKVIDGSVNANYILDGDNDDAYWLLCFAPNAGAGKVDVEILVADGEWQRVAEGKQTEPGEPLGRQNTAKGDVSFTHLFDAGDGSMVYVSHDVRNDAWRVAAVDEQGALHPADNIWSSAGANFVSARAQFHLPPERITSVVLLTRSFNKRVLVKDVTLDPAKPTKPQVVVEDVPEKK